MGFWGIFGFKALHEFTDLDEISQEYMIPPDGPAQQSQRKKIGFSDFLINLLAVHIGFICEGLFGKGAAKTRGGRGRCPCFFIMIHRFIWKKNESLLPPEMIDWRLHKTGSPPCSAKKTPGGNARRFF